MGTDHYFTATPSGPENLRSLPVTLAGRDVEVVVADGVFSAGRLDTGTRVLLRKMGPVPEVGDILDLGCGWGPVALTCALQAPDATVWAVDVNERALDLVRRNATTLGLGNVRAVRPDEVPGAVALRSIRSNPPIRVGKTVLHDMMTHWLRRLAPGGDGWFVVQRNLGSDSLQRWLAGTLDHGFTVERAATGSGYRLLRVRRGQAGDGVTPA